MSKTFSFLLYAIVLISFFSCKEEEVEYSSNSCKANPAFIQALGFNPKHSFFSTSDDKIMGLVLRETERPGDPNARILKTYQHPTWKTGGWLAPILLDEYGNIYTSPAPFINIWNNPIKNNNTIYKVDSQTGVMEIFLQLPNADSINTQNPFGIIGMAYLCDPGVLYVSSVAGSNRKQEKGHIYCIDTKSKKIIDQLDNIDAMGMGISYITGKRELYFGTGRNSDVNAITLLADGKFDGKSRHVFSLLNLGPRGDDKVRKIITRTDGNLMIMGMEFNYNLIAPREKQETAYNFLYDEVNKKWNYVP